MRCLNILYINVTTCFHCEQIHILTDKYIDWKKEYGKVLYDHQVEVGRDEHGSTCE